MRRVFIVQARMTSTRLPGKVLMDLDGKPLLSRQLARLKACRTADDIVVACTTNSADEPIAELCGREGVRVFRGSENDVLARYVGAAREANADVIVRVTSDCPLICPEICDLVVDRLLSSGCDYASNALKRTYPRGLDCEALTNAALARVAAEGTSAPAREHVTWRIHTEDRASYRLSSVEDTDDHSGLRWTVDEPADLEAIRLLWKGLGLSNRMLSYREILAYALAHPEVAAVNSGVAQKKS
ncbi:MAG TPA: glycosyltransferase family protein [Elusimicrobiota bacterium]|nr:glycosyltransferase family protein [Elusimicrobiota bacterium]